MNDLYHNAARTGAIEVIKAATRRDVNKKDEDGMTPVHWAASCGHLDCLRLLIIKGYVCLMSFIYPLFCSSATFIVGLFYRRLQRIPEISFQNLPKSFTSEERGSEFILKFVLLVANVLNHTDIVSAIFPSSFVCGRLSKRYISLLILLVSLLKFNPAP